MSKKVTNVMILTMTVFMSIVILSCKKDNIENKQTLDQLYKIYKSGEISECKFNGQTVYSAGLNAMDAGSVIYDKDGKQIGSCNYGWGHVDTICNQLTGCEVIYRVTDNIWGQPAVNKYSLGK